VQDAFGETREKLYLVRETKGRTDEASLRGLEEMKIECAKRHFGTIEVDYDAVSSAQEVREKMLEKYRDV
jgi:type III restriction enzyme